MITSSLVKKIGEVFPLEALPCETTALKASGMKFSLLCYKAKGLGHVSVMTANGFCGLMKMDTLIIVPYQKDMPLLSYDRIVAMGNDALIIEAYDTTVGKCDLSALDEVKAQYSALPQKDPGEHWYDNIKLSQSVSCKGKAKKHGKDFDSYANKYLDSYIKACKDASSVDVKAKKEKNMLYSEGLLSNGGPATDVFVKTLGKEKTESIFRSILFGTDRY